MFGHLLFRIPPTQLVDCSYSTYWDGRLGSASPNPTNAVRMDELEVVFVLELGFVCRVCHCRNSPPPARLPIVESVCFRIPARERQQQEICKRADIRFIHSPQRG